LEWDRTDFVDEEMTLQPTRREQPSPYPGKKSMFRKTQSLLSSRWISILTVLIFPGVVSLAPFQEAAGVSALEAGGSLIAGVALEADETIPAAGRMGLSPFSKDAPAPHSAERFAVFNARQQNRWSAYFDTKSGLVKLLAGGPSKRYENGPEAVATSFLKDAHGLLGLKEDLSDIRIEKVDQTPIRNHVRFRQTHRGTPVMGVQVLVHSNPEGQVTMVQNDTLQDIQPANEDRIREAVAAKAAQEDLHAMLGHGIVLSTAGAEKWITLHKGKHYYVWRVTVPTRNPLGFWVYHVNAETGEVIYKGDEIQALRTGKGKGYRSNVNWHNGVVSHLSLKYLYSADEGNTDGNLWGPHAAVYDYSGNDPSSPDFSFLYDPFQKKDWFDAVQAYYHVNTIWDWWNETVLRKYGPLYPAYFHDLSTPVIVNWPDLCNAFYSSNLGAPFHTPGFIFGNEESCSPGSEDLVVDNDIFRHEYAHAMMDWCGFEGQFGGPVNYYGRSMGEGNADWFGYLYSGDTEVADVGWSWSSDGYVRSLDNTRMYPYDVDHPSTGLPEEHYTGEIWGGLLYDLSNVLKTEALPYVYQSSYYFSTLEGYMYDYPDFFDAIWAQYLAEWDLTGKTTNTTKAWGSWTSRGISGLLRPSYASTNYFGSGSPGSDDGCYFYWMFPPKKSITTEANLLLTGDAHEYVIENSAAGPLNLSASVRSTTGGLANPRIWLYTEAGGLVSFVEPLSSNEALLTKAGLSPGRYVLMVTGEATAPARGYYTFEVTLQ
jgi:Fungalysin/Thermolysin Propeptide Motif